jgi:hypothetical protein
MRTIYKYLLEPADIQTLELPRFAKLLCVQIQDGFPYLWAEVDTDQPTEHRYFRTYGTGHPHVPEDKDLPEEYAPKYLGTYQLRSKLVFHVYEGLWI